MTAVPIGPPKLVEKVYLDPKTGRQVRTYFMGGRHCPTVRLNSPMARRFAGYTLIRVDLLDAQAWLAKAYEILPTNHPRHDREQGRRVNRYLNSTTDESSFKLIKALWFAALVLYGKCYTQAEGRRVKLERSNLPPGLCGYHSEVVTLRDTIVAHAGQTSHEFAELNLVLDPRPRTGGFWLSTNVKRIDFSDDRKDPVTFEQVITASIEHVEAKLRELEVKIKEKDLFVHPIEYWHRQAHAKRG